MQGAALAALAYTPLSGGMPASSGLLALPPASGYLPLLSLPTAAGLLGGGGGGAAVKPEASAGQVSLQDRNGER